MVLVIDEQTTFRGHRAVGFRSLEAPNSVISAYFDSFTAKILRNHFSIIHLQICSKSMRMQRGVGFVMEKPLNETQGSPYSHGGKGGGDLQWGLETHDP